MKVEVRAVIILNGRLVVHRMRKAGEEHLQLPGGLVGQYESVEAALEREIREETGLQIAPGQLIYAFEVFSRFRYEDVNLVFLAQPVEPLSDTQLQALTTVDLDAADEVLPPILTRIRDDAANQWAETPRWLGNIWDSARGRTGASREATE